MTQQKDTEHGTPQPGQTAAASQPAAASPAGGSWQPAAAPAPPAAPGPVYPSPYLDGGMPQAYLAPPQAGKPRYGEPPAARVPRSLGGQPGARQDSRGQQGSRPGPGTGPGRPGRRDPSLAPPWQRLVASVIDWFVIMAVSVIAFWSQLSQVWGEVRAVSTRYPNLTSPAAQAAINSIMRDTANQHALLYWFLGIFGVALAYYWAQHAAWGATLGKRAFGIRVVRASDRSPVGVLAAGLRAVALLFGPALFLLVVSSVSVLGGVLWAVDAGLPLVDARAQSLHDKIARTVVIGRPGADQPREPGPW